MCTFNISLLAISQAWIINNLTLFLLLVYVLAPAPAMLPATEAKLWCEPGSLPSLAWLPQLPPASPVGARWCSHSPPQPHQPSFSEDNTRSISSAIPTSLGQRCSIYLWPSGLLPCLPPRGMMASTEVTTIHSCHSGPFLLKVCEGCPSFSSNNSSCWPLPR